MDISNKNESFWKHIINLWNERPGHSLYLWNGSSALQHDKSHNLLKEKRVPPFLILNDYDENDYDYDGDNIEIVVDIGVSCHRYFIVWPLL